MPKKSANKTSKLRLVRPVNHHVKEWRTAKGWSLTKLSRESGVSPSMISQLENGKTSYTQNVLEALATALDAEPWQLLAIREPGATAEMFKTMLRQYNATRNAEMAGPAPGM